MVAAEHVMTTPNALLQSGQDALNRGDFASAVAAFDELARIVPRALLAWCGRAAAYYGVGEFTKSLAAAKHALSLAGDDARVFYVLAPAAFATGDAEGVEACRKFVRGAPPDAGREIARFWVSRLMEKDYMSEAATAFSLYALTHLDDESTALELVHHYLNGFRLDAARQILDRVFETSGPSARIFAMRARIDVMRGDPRAAEKSALSAIELDPHSIPAFVVLSEVAPHLIDSQREADLEASVRNPDLAEDTRTVGLIALGRGREKRGEFDRAFAAFAEAKARAKEAAASVGVRYNQNTDDARVKQTMTRFATGDFRGKGGAAPRKIFIIGMPRSGSTLIDQILAQHSAVATVGESQIIPHLNILIENSAKRGDRSFRDSAEQFADSYRNLFKRAANGRPVVVDKNLFNYEHCGLIADLDSEARFVIASREPADIALSIFKVKFLATLPWTNDLRDIAHSIAGYERLRDFWRARLGDRILTIDHESLVADFEASVRRLLDFCGLEFEPACLEFHTAERAVFTTSAAQVRRPVNADGVGRWRRYERHLEGFHRALDESRRRFADGA